MSSAELWSGGNYELVAARLAEIHETAVVTGGMAPVALLALALMLN